MDKRKYLDQQTPPCFSSPSTLPPLQIIKLLLLQKKKTRRSRSRTDKEKEGIYRYILSMGSGGFSVESAGFSSVGGGGVTDSSTAASVGGGGGSEGVSDSRFLGSSTSAMWVRRRENLKLKVKKKRWLRYYS